MAGGAVDQRQRRRKTFTSTRFVPGVLKIEISGETPAGRGIARREKAAHPALGQKLYPAIPGGRDVDQRGDTALQQSAIGELGARGSGLVVGWGERLRAFIEPGHVHAAQAVLLTHSAIERLVLGMRVDVDQPG